MVKGRATLKSSETTAWEASEVNVAAIQAKWSRAKAVAGRMKKQQR